MYFDTPLVITFCRVALPRQPISNQAQLKPSLSNLSSSRVCPRSAQLNLTRSIIAVVIAKLVVMNQFQTCTVQFHGDFPAIITIGKVFNKSPKSDLMQFLELIWTVDSNFIPWPSSNLSLLKRYSNTYTLTFLKLVFTCFMKRFRQAELCWTSLDPSRYAFIFCLKRYNGPKNHGLKILEIA